MENLVAMARAAEKDERLSDGALYGKLAARIEHLEAALRRIRATAPWSDGDGHAQCIKEARVALGDLGIGALLRDHQ